MGRKPSLPATVRAQIVALHEEGYSERQLANKFQCSKKAVHLAIHRYQETGGFNDRPRSGRPRKTSKRDDHAMKRMVVNSPSSSCHKIKKRLSDSGTDVSIMTVSRRLSNEFGLKSRKPAAKPRLTIGMKRKRLEFAKKYAHWTSEDWHKVLFSDESLIQQFNHKKSHVRRPVGARYDEKYTVMTMKHPPSQMIWGAMSAMGTAGLYFLPKNTTMNGARYLELLKSKLELHMGVHECSVFMHDGAPCHRSKLVSDYLNEKKIEKLAWPGNSPDLNPIENLWAVLKKKVAERQPSDAVHLVQVIKEVWVKEIDAEYCRTLVESMPRRLTDVVRAKGSHTKY